METRGYSESIVGEELLRRLKQQGIIEGLAVERQYNPENYHRALDIFVQSLNVVAPLVIEISTATRARQ